MKEVLSRIKYPKFFLLILTILIAYIIFKQRDFLPLHNLLFSMGYFGVFIVGMFFSYGFTAAPATAILLILAKEGNILLMGFIAGLGALVADLLIFYLIRLSFADEIKKLSNEKITRYIQKKIPLFLRKYVIPVIAGFIIASPLPDEIGVSLFSFSRNISIKIFSIISYLLNTLGIFIILIIGDSI